MNLHRQVYRLCRQQSVFPIFYRLFPEKPRDTNDYFYMYALEFLIQIEQESLPVRWLPSWLSQNNEPNIRVAIERLIHLCLTHFQDDLGRKCVLLAANTYRRLFKVMAVILPHQENLAKQQHLNTRYIVPEFCWAQLLSSKERNILIELDGLSLQATASFVQEYSKDKGFKENLAAKAIKDMYIFEAELVNSVNNYIPLLRESELDEIFPSEALSVTYDMLGYNCICVLKRYDKWEKHILLNYTSEIKKLAMIGSHAALDILDDNVTYAKDKKFLPDRFFFGDKMLFDKVSKLYD